MDCSNRKRNSRKNQCIVMLNFRNFTVGTATVKQRLHHENKAWCSLCFIETQSGVSVGNLYIIEVYFTLSEGKESESIRCDWHIFAKKGLHVINSEFKLAT